MVSSNGTFKFSNVSVVKYINSQTKISIYPNPAKDNLTVSLPSVTANATIKIINAAGKTLINSTNRSGRNLNVDISHLPKGSYLLQLYEGKDVSTLKFIK